MSFSTWVCTWSRGSSFLRMSPPSSPRATAETCREYWTNSSPTNTRCGLQFCRQPLMAFHRVVAGNTICWRMQIIFTANFKLFTGPSWWPQPWERSFQNSLARSTFRRRQLIPTMWECFRYGCHNASIVVDNSMVIELTNRWKGSRKDLSYIQVKEWRRLLATWLTSLPHLQEEETTVLACQFFRHR